jgi:tRNA dimethylallyltransferase
VAADTAAAKTAYALLGPTASGKSAIALAVANKFPIEIVSVDSAQVYRGMDIGTAKPTLAERARAPHHLIDLVDPDQSYSAGRFREDASKVVLEILKRKQIPLLVGGTMLYYRALAGGLDNLPQADVEIRKQIDQDAARSGWPAMHDELKKVDPQAAQRLAPNDAQRIQRALEVWRLTGKPLSSLQGAAAGPLPFALKACVLIPERAELHARIERRLDQMLDAGLVEEVKGLRAKYRLSAGMPSMRAVGYRQVWEYLEGGCDHATMRSRAIAATRQLAKRQVTWLRSWPQLLRLDAGSSQDAAVALDLLLREAA